MNRARAIHEVKAASYRLRGVSVGGVYTSLQVPELDAVFDVGMGLRTMAATPQIFLSHAHADHVGGLVSLLGIRGMMQKPAPRVFVPEASREDLAAAIASHSRLQRHELSVDWVGVKPGDEFEIRAGCFVRVFRTHHVVPSVGYQIFRKVQKLKSEFRDLEGAEIAKRRAAGESLLREEERLEVAYATDTLIRVLEKTPSLYQSRVLILECTFLDDRKSKEAVRAGCHIHLDEIVERAELFQNEKLVLMHFSQIYAPAEVHRILDERLPPSLRERVVAFAPERGGWPG